MSVSTCCRAITLKLKLAKGQERQMLMSKPKLMQVIGAEIETNLSLELQMSAKHMKVLLDGHHMSAEQMPILVLQKVKEIKESFVHHLNAL